LYGWGTIHAAQGVDGCILTVQKEECSMHPFKAFELEAATSNSSNSNCECGQIAYRVVRVNVDHNSNPNEVFLCGRHYLEALQSLKADSGPVPPNASIIL
jgi:hypothetical protein